MYEIGSEFNYEGIAKKRNILEAFEERVSGSGRYVEYLRCGRDSIGFVADDIIAGCEDASFDVLLPALSCDSMVKPFEVRGFKVSYYKLTPELAADEADLMDKLSQRAADEDSVHVVLIMNMFGMNKVTELAGGIKDKFPQVLVIEDMTHILTEPDKYLGKGSCADYYVGSIRKWLGVPDGAVAIGKSEFIMGALSGETDFTALRLQALTEKTEYLDNGDQELKAHFRKLLSDAEDSLSDGLDPYHMSDISAEILKDVDTENLRGRRSANYRNLYRLFSELPLCGKAFRLLPEIAEGDNGFGYEYTPFMLPIELDMDFLRRSAITDTGKEITRDLFEKKLAGRGIYAPVLWPISDEAADTCEVSKHFADNMLAFWIDQRYNRFDMEETARILGEELSKL